MSNRIIHFEIMGSDAGKSQKFYADMFGWKLGDPAPELGNYAMVDGSTAGLSGGISACISECYTGRPYRASVLL